MAFVFNGWPRKTIWRLFYAMSSFVHYFKAISELKLELQSGNAQLESKSAIFPACELEIWWMTLKNNRALLLYHFKLCASFRCHWWIQTGITFRKRQIWVKIGDLLSLVILIFDRWPWKTIGHLFYATLSFVHHFIAIGDSNWSYSSKTLNLCQNRWFFCPVLPWNLTDDIEKQ